jgi:hypothetical protein
MGILQFAGCGDTGTGAARVEAGGGRVGEGNNVVPLPVVPLPPLLDYSDDDGTVVGEEIDENALNSDEDRKMEEEDNQEDPNKMEVDGRVVT